MLISFVSAISIQVVKMSNMRGLLAIGIAMLAVLKDTHGSEEISKGQWPKPALRVEATERKGKPLLT